MQNDLDFRQKVFEIVKKIPRGKVTTYGQISKELRIKNYEFAINPKMVGWALHQNKDPNVPCHRVVDRAGRLAPNFAFDGAREQKRRLETEGVRFLDEMHVDLSKVNYKFQAPNNK